MGDLLNSKYCDAEASVDLFTWFCFARVEETPATPTAQVFRPGGSAFKRLAKLELLLSPDDVITGASLHVQRSFIAGNSANAGDLVKSFVYQGSDPHVGDLANEIMARSLADSSQPVLMRGDGPTASGAPSAAYQVYAGKKNHAAVGNLTLENRGDEFVITLGGAPPKSWFKRLFG